MSSESSSPSPSSVTWFLDYTGDVTNIFDPAVYDFIPGILNTYVVVVVDKWRKCDNPEQLNCSICFEEKHDPEICHLNCNHTFCIECTRAHLDTQDKSPNHSLTCPLCRANIVNVCVKNENLVERFYVQ